jgi:hypothetical protein
VTCLSPYPVSKWKWEGSTASPRATWQRHGFQMSVLNYRYLSTSTSRKVQVPMERRFWDTECTLAVFDTPSSQYQQHGRWWARYLSYSQ